MQPEIHFRRNSELVPIPTYQTPGAVGFDIAVSEVCEIPPHETKIIATGLFIAVPKDMVLILAARSSVSKKGLMLANGIGVIDQDYSGPTDEIKLAFHNLTEKTYTTAVGERLAQGLFMPVIKASFVEKEILATESRGGFGSTGDK